jgi:hypothetical protein
MDTNTIVLIVICIVIGALFGGLLGSLGKKPDGGKEKGGRKALLKVWQDPQKSGLVVDMDGKEFSQSVQLNARQRSQLSQLILTLNDWLEARQGTQEPGERLRSRQVTPIEPPLAEKTPRGLNLSPSNVLSNALKADVPRSQLPTESIVGQIDAILQGKLKGSPLQGKAIRLMEVPGVGMVVMVGLERYDQVEQVPDRQIQAVIRAAVREWERG